MEPTWSVCKMITWLNISRTRKISGDTQTLKTEWSCRIKSVLIILWSQEKNYIFPLGRRSPFTHTHGVLIQAAEIGRRADVIERAHTHTHTLAPHVPSPEHFHDDNQKGFQGLQGRQWIWKYFLWAWVALAQTTIFSRRQIMRQCLQLWDWTACTNMVQDALERLRKAVGC